MTKHIPIKVMTRLQKPFEDHAIRLWNRKYFVTDGLEKINNKVYNVSWINK